MAMLEIYIEALLVDEDLADQVWEAWDKGEIDDQVAWSAWWTISNCSKLIYTQLEKEGSNCQVKTPKL